MPTNTDTSQRIIDIQALLPGMVIVQIVAQNGPVKIRKSGLVTSQDMVKGLAEMGVQQLEIDPAQTVELEPATPSPSQTQRLLARGSERDSNLDHALSDQFNRSLFLPSVQELPGRWQYYGKQSVMGCVIVLGGFALGWLAATHDQWLGALMPSASPVVTSPAPAVMSEQPPVETSQPATLASNIPPVEQGNLAQLGSDSEPQHATENVPAQTVAAVQPTPSQSTLNQPTAAPVDETGVEITNDNFGPSGQISPDLLRRFEQAIADIDGRATDSVEAEPQTTGVNVPHVSELPAWVLTDLPALSFSAHMYASDVQERWVRVNGTRLYEGQSLEEGVTLVAIEPQHVILAYRGHEFSLPALTDW